MNGPPNSTDPEVRDLARDLRDDPARAALVVAETAVGVRRLFDIFGKAQGRLLIVLVAVVIDLAIRLIAAAAEPAKALTPF